MNKLKWGRSIDEKSWQAFGGGIFEASLRKIIGKIMGTLGNFRFVGGHQGHQGFDESSESGKNRFASLVWGKK